MALSISSSNKIKTSHNKREYKQYKMKEERREKREEGGGEEGGGAKRILSMFFAAALPSWLIGHPHDTRYFTN